MTLEQIIDGCRNGDIDARRELYERYGSVWYGVVRRYINDTSIAEDLLHDGFVTLYTKIAEYRGDGSFEGWCRRILVNTIFSYFRKKSPLSESDDMEALTWNSSVAPTAIEELSAGEIKRCIDELPVGYRTIFNMHAVEEYSYSEIAEIMNISESTVRSQYLRARGRLVEIMNGRFDL